MKGSVLVLLGCFALFFAAPSRSYSISEDDQLANRRDTQSGSPSSDAATSGDAGESKTVKTNGDASPEDESVAGGAQAEKSKIRKRDTRRLVAEGMESVITGIPPLRKDQILATLQGLGKGGAKCFEQAFDYIEAHELPPLSADLWDPENTFHWSDMVKWLEIMKDSVSECLMNSVNLLNSESSRLYYGTPDSVGMPSHPDTFTDEEFMSTLTDIGLMLKKCFEDVIGHLKATSYGPGDTVQRSSKSFSDLLMELTDILPLFDGAAIPAGDAVRMSAPTRTVAPYSDPPSYKKRNSPDKPREYRHYSNLPGFPHSQYVYGKDNPKSIVRQFSGFRGEAGQTRHAPGLFAENASTAKFSLLETVLDDIYANLKQMTRSPVNMKAAPVPPRRGRPFRVLYSGNGESPAMGNPGTDPECVHKREQ